VPSGRAATPAPKAQRNFTNPESRIIETNDGFVQGDNAQIAVDAEHQVIVAHALTNQPPDPEHFAPMLDRVVRACRQTPKRVSAEARAGARGTEQPASPQGGESWVMLLPSPSSSVFDSKSTPWPSQLTKSPPRLWWKELWRIVMSRLR